MNPTIGRMDNIDALASKFASHSLYNYTLNNPLNVIDPDGNESRDIWGNTTFNGFVGDDGSGNFVGSTGGGGDDNGGGDDKKKKENKKGENTNKAATVLSGGWAVALGEPTPVGEVTMGLVTGAAILYYGPALLAKMEKEIEGIKNRIVGPNGYQYALIANKAGNYPVYVLGSSKPNGYKFLNVGEVWKYGETTTKSRYSDSFKASIGGGVTEVPMVYGNQTQIKVAEKISLYNYFIQNGELPPGNKIFR